MGQAISSVGSGIQKSMKETMKDQMESQMKFQQETMKLQMERQMIMQNEMRERMMSMQLARAREIFKYYSCFYVCVVTAGTIATIKKKVPTPLIPALPLSFVLAFQYDAAYGTLMARCRDEAEKIMKEEHERLNLPVGMPTYDSIEAKRMAGLK